MLEVQGAETVSEVGKCAEFEGERKCISLA